jgi:hypothetical protein
MEIGMDELESTNRGEPKAGVTGSGIDGEAGSKVDAPESTGGA